MGSDFFRKIIILALLFFLTLFLIYWIPSSGPIKKKISLNLALSNIKGWTPLGFTVLDPEIISALDLDDYVNQSYYSGREKIHLYIGYYYSNKKIGAAHDPLVCFPGQGWATSNIRKKEFPLASAMRRSVFSSVMTVQKGQEKEMIIYWFQSAERTAGGTFFQKLNAFRERLSHGRQDNAFVRLSIPLQDRSDEEAYKIAHRFIKSFYPVFLFYIRG